jgi:hypothetical protein
MLEPKVPAVGASVGFVLSFLTGLFSGAAFLVVLVRAVLMAAFFGLLALCASLAVKKFLPELVDGSGDDFQSADTSGSSVDISIGESGNDVNPFREANDPGADQMVPDFLEQTPGFAGNTDFSAPVPAAERTDTGTARTEPLQATKVPVRHAEAGTKQSAVTVDGLDFLPDLQDFIPATESVRDASGEDSVMSQGATPMGDSLFSASESRGLGVESETMAKAIRTILSRDS